MLLYMLYGAILGLESLPVIALPTSKAESQKPLTSIPSVKDPQFSTSLIQVMLDPNFKTLVVSNYDYACTMVVCVCVFV